MIIDKYEYKDLKTNQIYTITEYLLDGTHQFIVEIRKSFGSIQQYI
jgi:hypothetical protein